MVGVGAVAAHLVTPASAGLFSTAGLSSGAFSTWISSPMIAQPPQDPTQGAQTTFDALVRESECDSSSPSHGQGRNSTNASTTAAILACLEAIPAAKLVSMAAVRAVCPRCVGTKLCKFDLFLHSEQEFVTRQC